MSKLEVQRWIDNADKGIAQNIPSFVLSSSKQLKSIGRADEAEKVLRRAFEVFHDNALIFRELAATITDRDAVEGLEFAQQHVDILGDHANYQRAIALSKLERVGEAIRVIEEIVRRNEEFRKDRFVVSKLVSLYNAEGRFDDAILFIEPLIDDGTFTDIRMKQLLATVMTKARKSPSKVLHLLKDDVDPRSTLLKQKAAEILAIGVNAPLVRPNLMEAPTGAPNGPSEGDPYMGSNLAVADRSERLAGKSVFLVHGHNGEKKETVARFLEQLGLQVTILHEKADKGRTIVEKFEEHTDVQFAVILLTADDVGAAKADASRPQPRARQNVVFEFGFFLGRIGRKHVCALKEDGVEVPSDLSGVLYVPLDAEGFWKLKLVRELKAAGIPVDANRAV
ncbi:MAG TPA: nucleotide-binding protein [Verrucomicrobiae bacterium]|nr:nucleotide-binding protein [Verrucomicrobiae bacterium]